MFNLIVPQRSKELEIRTVGNEAIVHDVRRQKVHVLNKTAGRILNLCDGTASVAAIAGVIGVESNADAEAVMADVQRIVERFAELELVS